MRTLLMLTMSLCCLAPASALAKPSRDGTSPAPSARAAPPPSLLGPVNLVVGLSGRGLGMLDPAFARRSGAAIGSGFAPRLDIHVMGAPVAASIGYSWMSWNTGFGTDEGSSLGGDLLVHQIDLGAKVFFAPHAWMFQPFAHVFGQVLHGRLEVTDYNAQGHLATRSDRSTIGALGVSAGARFMTPRRDNRRLGIGGSFEVGVVLGEGGEIDAAPALQFESGGVDLGPLYFEAGLVASF